MNNLLVAQSGGPTVAINATLVGILQEVGISGEINRVYGARNGIEGVIKGEFIELSRLIGDLHTQNVLMHTPAAALGTGRFKLPDCNNDEKVYEKIIENLQEKEVKYFIFIGGNDSMDTVNKLYEYCRQKDHDIKIIGAPKTIDNDLCVTDHCPGFGSAAKYIATTISEIAFDISSYSIPSVTIVEIMGRDSGWLTAAAALARINGGIGADLIYLCEREFSQEKFINDIREKRKNKSGILVAVSEGLKYSNGEYLSDKISSGEIDDFGHKYIAGVASVLEKIVRKEFGCKVRVVGLNLMQRAAAHIASETDITEALQLGHKALYCALNGETGKMVAVIRVSNQPYVIYYVSVPVSEVANKEKKVPLDWISSNGSYVTRDMLNYLTPLIQGQVYLTYDNGVPKHYKIY